MMYLSWDVGITNLAYCLMECLDKEQAKFKIKNWGIINLTDRPPLCSGMAKDGTPCKYKVVFHTIIGKERVYYCKAHSKGYAPEEVNRVQCKDTDKCAHIINSKNTAHICNKKAISSIVEGGTNNPYCKAHLNVHIKQFNKDKSLKKVSNVNANKIPMQTLATNLFEFLDTVPEFTSVHEVLIENQPTMKNPTMKTISSILFSYFVLRGTIDKQTISNVKFICPSNKLKVGSNAGKKLKDIKDQGGNSRSVYNITKKMSTKFCKELIKGDKVNLDFINKQKKQDDLCDSFLQGYYYMFCRDGVPKDIQVILNKLVTEDGKSDGGDKGIDLTNLVID
jgi:hypothetical protein